MTTFHLGKTKIKHSELYLKANYFQNSGQVFKAIHTYNNLFALKAPDHIYDGYFRLLSQANQSHLIVKLIDKKQEMFKDDLEIQLIFALSLLNTNRDKQAEKILQKLKEKHPNNEQIVYYLTAMHEKNNKPQKALDDINRFLTKNAPQKGQVSPRKHAIFYFMKAKIYLKIGDHQKSLEAINKSINIFPQFDKAILFKALLSEQTQNFDTAVECYEKFLELTGPNLPITKQIVQILFSQKKFAEAVKHLKKLSPDNNSNKNPAYFFDLALLEWKAKNLPTAQINAEKALDLNPHFHKAKMLLIQILMTQQKYETILQKIESWLIQPIPNSNPEKFNPQNNPSLQNRF